MYERNCNFNDALKLAMEFEEEGRKYYLAARGKSNHPLGKMMFQSLADDEIRHIKRITLLFDSLTEKGEWPKALPTDRTRIKTVFEEAMEAIDKNVKGGENDLEAIEQALTLERKGYEFYRKMSDESAGQDEKDFFKALAAEENAHIDILQTTQEYLQRPWDFFAGEERSIYEGG